MKKIMFFLSILLLPLNVLAYSDYIIPGGQTLGIEVNNNGIMVIGFYKINNKLNKNKLKVGDVIIKIANKNVITVDELVDAIEDNVKDNIVTMTIKRGNEIFDTNFELIKQDEKYKTGLYVKDSVTGIGTLTYIDPETKIFGALGHEMFNWRMTKFIIS